MSEARGWVEIRVWLLGEDGVPVYMRERGTLDEMTITHDVPAFTDYPMAPPKAGKEWRLRMGEGWKMHRGAPEGYR